MGIFDCDAFDTQASTKRHPNEIKMLNRVLLSATLAPINFSDCIPPCLQPLYITARKRVCGSGAFSSAHSLHCGLGCLAAVVAASNPVAHGSGCSAPKQLTRIRSAARIEPATAVRCRLMLPFARRHLALLDQLADRTGVERGSGPSASSQMYEALTNQNAHTSFFSSGAICVGSQLDGDQGRFARREQMERGSPPVEWMR